MSNELPVIPAAKPKRLQRLFVHTLRVLLFISILVLIRWANGQKVYVDTALAQNESAKQFVVSTFGDGSAIERFEPKLGGNVVLSESGDKLGYLLQTSPESDHLIGYSGPTNCLIALGLDNKIKSMVILTSGDTFDHVAEVKEDAEFFESFEGLGFESTREWQTIDGVTGATLTSYAIIASVANRMNGSAPILKFEQTPDLQNVVELFKEAATISESRLPSVWDVANSEGERIGSVLTTTPSADHLSGYQGPTATLAVFDLDGKCVGLVVDQTYENEPYATYLNDDYPFQGIYKGKTLEEIAAMDVEALGIEGVSGATMTSLSVADALPLAASKALAPVVDKPTKQVATRSLISYWADAITILLTVIGVIFSYSKLSRHRLVRMGYQVGVIVLLGYVNGHLLSQALFAGWSANSIPWNVAPGIVLLSLAAVLVPVFSKHQPYCQHICPFGAMQQLAAKRFKKRVKISKQIVKLLELIPLVLLAFVVWVAMKGVSVNLAAIEPFDAFAFRVAGISTLVVFGVGLAFSLVSPMAYCRFGCPTGAMLNFLKFRADSHRLGGRDWAALLLLAFGIALYL